MRELRPACDIADRKGAAVGGAQPRIDGDPFLGRTNPGGRQVKRRNARPAAGRHQQMRPGDPLAAGQAHENAVGPAFDAEDLDLRADRDAFRGEASGETGGELGIVAGQDGSDVEDGDPRPEAAMRLRHLDPDRAAADDDQMLGQFAIGEHRLVGQVGNAVEPRDIGDRRVRAGGDDKAPRANLDAVGRERARPGETRFGVQDADPEPLEALSRVVWRNCRDDLLHTVGNCDEVDLRHRAGDAEYGAAPHAFGHPRSREQRLRRHAAKIEAIPAHRAALDQHDLGAHLRRAGGHR
jgi:hypothetical protein